MPRKPADLIYGENGTPPVPSNIVLGFKHICLFFISTLMPVLVITQLGSSVNRASAGALVSLSMIAGGITTILQAWGKGPFGSGYLCPSVCGPSYLKATVTAAVLEVLPTGSIDEMRQADFFAIPYIRNMGWSFDFSIVVPLVVATLCSTFKSVGDLVTCQKINDPDWKRNDTESLVGSSK